MREILFRGKVIESTIKEAGEWVYGHLVVRKDHDDEPEQCFMCEEGHMFIRCLNKMPCTYKVDPETIGQYTGLKDKNGKRIFEGDIVREHHSWQKPNKYSAKYRVFMDEGRGGWFPFACGDGCGCCESDVISASCSEIIGNIHDNPELIAEVQDG